MIRATVLAAALFVGAISMPQFVAANDVDACKADCFRWSEVKPCVDNCPPCRMSLGNGKYSCWDYVRATGKCPKWSGILDCNTATTTPSESKPSDSKPTSGEQPSSSSSGQSTAAPAVNVAPTQAATAAVAAATPAPTVASTTQAPAAVDSSSALKPKFSGPCALPDDPLVVPITPGAQNKGWAMSPDQRCFAGKYCPYACASGYYSAQWDPSARLCGPNCGSMNGGLKCNADGSLTKPFPSRPLCLPGDSRASIKNLLSTSVSACQTVYPGNEAMLISTVVAPGQTKKINVTPRDYWLGTSAQYYVNLAGSNENQCIWGTDKAPVGNWAPYVFGAGVGADGNAYISVVYNHLYKSRGFSTSAAYNVRITCDDPSKCNGLPCTCSGGSCTRGGCTVTVRNGGHANFELF